MTTTTLYAEILVVGSGTALSIVLLLYSLFGNVSWASKLGGGSNDNPAPTTADLRTISYAVESNTIVADLGMVPNQPLAFADSKDKRRSEDDLIAYTRVRHFSTKDDTWLVRLAMVKSGVRAMDAIQEFLASEAGGRLALLDDMGFETHFPGDSGVMPTSLRQAP